LINSFFSHLDLKPDIEGRTGKGPAFYAYKVYSDGIHLTMVSPPGTVINTKPWSIGKTRYTLIGLERPKGNRMSIEILARRIDKNIENRLWNRGGPIIRPDFAKRLLGAFNT